MKKLDLMVLRAFFHMLLLSLILFSFVVVLVELFSNLWRYLQNDAVLAEILFTSLLYYPKALTLALPPSILFAIAFTLGSYQANNELLALFSSGISLLRFAVPIIALSALLSVGSYFFQEHLVIPKSAQKQILTDRLSGRSSVGNNNNVVILSGEGRFLYKIDYYNAKNESLTGVSVLIRDSQGNFKKRIESEWAQYDESGLWVFHRVRLFEVLSDKRVTEQFFLTYRNPELSESPSSFRKQIGSVNELQRKEAKVWIERLRKSGSERYHKELTAYYERFSFSLTPLIVTLLSISLSGYFKKNILLMSLLSSVIVSVLYYVSEMVLVLFAQLGIIRPITGAWTSALLFLCISLFLLKKAKS
ncbi:LptF/LptG family permease [Sediminispirochaeta bajacaliforniensis]|uniref:LptF/LptG family permease n=1 Tax=Sediminispirochaeta bajacaliforniensis TaxID=148 RepID=UPI00036982C2|nr:LptF/LptG family permease [Sediminispirochaeta bajacaliforniensis]